MHKLCRIDIEDREGIARELGSFIRRLKDRLPVREVYLYGSFARGEIHEGSDIDLLIVGDFKERVFERIGKVLALTELPIEPLVYTVEEFESLKKGGNPFIKECLLNSRRLL